MDLKKSEGGGGITRLLPENYGTIKKVEIPNDSESVFGYASVMASVPQTQPEKEAAFSDLLTSVLSPAEAAEHVEAATATEEAADLSALDGLNLDFPPLNANNSNNYSSVSEVVAAAIMATSSEDTQHQNFTSGIAKIKDLPFLPSFSAFQSYNIR